MCAGGPVTPSFVTVPAPPGTRFGPIRRFTEIDSTNRYLLDEARAGAAEGAVAVADYQSAGRGRLGRRWEAPPGSNLLTSVLLRPVLATDELHLCTVAVALAAAAACEHGAGVAAELKWPNDLVVGGRKLAGILAEAVPRGPGGAGDAVVVGLGLNVRWPPPAGHAGAPSDGTQGTDGTGADKRTEGTVAGEGSEVALAATSIWREAGRATEPLALLRLVLEHLEGRLVDLADRHGRDRLAADYRRRCGTVGATVRVTLPGEVFTGRATGITPQGHLVVEVGGKSGPWPPVTSSTCGIRPEFPGRTHQVGRGGRSTIDPP